MSSQKKKILKIFTFELTLFIFDQETNATTFGPIK